MHRRLFLQSGLGFAAAAASHESTVSLRAGEPVFLFAEDLLEDHWQIRRRLVPPRRPTRPVIVKDRPWEGMGPYLYGSVLRDPADNLWKCWYAIHDPERYRARQPWAYRVGYATSRDGQSWTKPELGLVEDRGSTRNNMIPIGTRMSEAIDVCLAPPDSNAPARFLGLTLDKGVHLWLSDDGIHWRPHQPSEVEPRHSDTHNSLCWDPARRRWLIHLRPPVHAGDRAKRRIAVMESTDLKSWSRPVTILRPDESDPPEFYSMPVFRRGNLFFGMLQVYDRTRESLEIELVYSADAYRWHRLPGHPTYLPTGAKGSFDSGMVTTADEMIFDGDRMLLYYGGWNGDHRSDTRQAAIGVATAQCDRFLAWEAGASEPGFLLTRPCTIEAAKLFANADVHGELQVAITDPEGVPIQGFDYAQCRAIRGDSLRHELVWGDRALAALRSRLVRLRIRMRDASLYALSAD